MPVWLLDIVWFVLEKLFGIVRDDFKTIADAKAKDQAIDDHAAAVAKEEKDAQTPAELDKADSDLLSGR